ncbi:MAG: hypothetical protein ACE5JR_00785 [Gemmatimonadota bacterium]
MARTIYDDGLLKWEVYVSGGQPNSKVAARIFFLCLDAPMTPARCVLREDGDVAAAQRAIMEMSDDDLRELLATSVEVG